MSGCDICHGGDNLSDHKSSLLHRFNFALWEWTNYRKSIVKDRNGVEVKVELHNIVTTANNLIYTINERKGCHEMTVVDQRANFEMRQNNGISYIFTVKNIMRSKNIFIVRIDLLHPIHYFTLEDFEGQMKENTVLELAPNASYSFKVTFRLTPVQISSYAIPIAIHFQPVEEVETEKKGNKNFTIYREMLINVMGTLEFNQKRVELKKSPFTSALWHDEIKMWHNPQVQIPFQNTYAIPPQYQKVIKMGLKNFQNMTGEQVNNLTEIERKISPGYVTKTNYKDFFHTALWTDEKGAELMLQRYNMENVKLTIVKIKFVELEVPGLAEKRPSLIKGDVVHIRLHNDHTGYKGVINTINNLTIWIQGVASELMEIIKVAPDTEFDVAFQLGRLPYERMHSGVDRCVRSGMVDYLFPENILIARSGPGRRIPDDDFINSCIKSNPEQRSAVEHIVFKNHNAAPYIVFGPPGTGKTITIVEAILQLVKRDPKVVILVCAPANAACDMLASKLIQWKRFSTSQLIRVHTETRDWETVPEEIRPYSNHIDFYTRPSEHELMKYQVIVTTLILSGRYRPESFTPNYLFIDEAAQAMEPEVAVAIGLMSRRSHLILAGDPKQLGPICTSAVAEHKLGLSVSLLERLMKLPLYMTNNDSVITTLKLNFRSHPEVLQIPNELFYEGKLQAVSYAARTDPIAGICVYDKFSHRKVRNLAPASCLEFCAIFAKEMRQGRSPSYFNQKEAEMVVNYVRALINLRELQVLQSEIGIITPYIRQVYRVKDLLKTDYPDVEVGTTEVFQGREKRIIIISTVRAQYDLLLHDRKYKLGFVSNEKRFNVALTRAMSKLIIIGCPNVLRYDKKNWLKFIEECERKQSYFGGKRDVRDDKLKQVVIGRLSHVHWPIRQ